MTFHNGKGRSTAARVVFGILTGAMLMATAARADDTCRWAQDGDCDDPSVPGAVSGLCEAGTDTTDCTGLIAPTDTSNICLFANDGQCDDPMVPGHVTRACAPGTDDNDCGLAAIDPPDTREEPLGDACPPGTIVMNGSCVDEDLFLEEVPLDQ